MLRIIALALALLFFWIGPDDAAFYAGGAFFMILFLGTFLRAAHAIIALGGALSAMALACLGMGVIKLGRSPRAMSLEDDPLSFWIEWAVVFGCGMALLIGGIAHARKQKPPDGKTDAEATSG